MVFSCFSDFLPTKLKFFHVPQRGLQPIILSHGTKLVQHGLWQVHNTNFALLGQTGYKALQ